jgi:hypothetical protein
MGVFLTKKSFFIQSKIVKIGLKLCLLYNTLGQKFFNKKSNQPNNVLVPDPNQNESSWLEKTGSTLTRTENRGLIQN